MEITSLKVRGFRSLKEVLWEPGRLNVIIGPNGSGKSNLMRSLDLLRSAAVGNLDEAITQQGGMRSVLWDHQARGLFFEVTIRVLVDYQGKVRPTDLRYSLELESIGAAGNFRVSQEDLDVLNGQGRGFVRDHKGNVALGDHAYEMRDTETALSIVRRQRANTSEEMNAYIVRSTLSSLRSYHDLYVARDAPLRQAAIAKYERALQPDGQNLIAVLHTLYTEDPDFEEAIDSGMRAGFGADFKKLLFPPAADQRVQLRVRLSGMRMAPSAEDLSDGTLRFLMLLTILKTAPEWGLVAINEPETSLHPSMLKVVAEFASEAAQRTQVILATQSPELLDALSTFEPTVTVVNWSDGQTQLNKVEEDELKRWLNEYTLGALQRSGELEEMA
jgi:predicted ATPase